VSEEREMICKKCGLEMFRDNSYIAKNKRDVITYKCKCGFKYLKGILRSNSCSIDKNLIDIKIKEKRKWK